MKMFTRHLKENDMTYKEHLKCALGYSIESGKASVIFAIHAFIPFLFEQAGSDKLDTLVWKIRKNSLEH